MNRTAHLEAVRNEWHDRIAAATDPSIKLRLRVAAFEDFQRRKAAGEFPPNWICHCGGELENEHVTCGRCGWSMAASARTT